MNIEITSKKQEPLMKRTEFNAKIIFEGKTPSRMDFRKELAHALGSKTEMTVIRKIDSSYGAESALVNGYFYDDENKMKDLERRYVLTRHLDKQGRIAEKEKLKEARNAAKAAKSKK